MTMGEPSLKPSRPPPPAADYNLRIVWTIARYIEDRFGQGGLRELADVAGLEPGAFDDKNRWVDATAFEALLAKARSMMESDDEFKRSCIYRMKEAYGPLRYILWATTVGAVFGQGAKQFGLVSTCGELATTAQGPTWAHFRFTSRVPFSRLNCLVRQAQSAALPTLWGLPPAYLREDACIAHGDGSCELHYHWYEARRWLPALG